MQVQGLDSKIYINPVWYGPHFYIHCRENSLYLIVEKDNAYKPIIEQLGLQIKMFKGNGAIKLYPFLPDNDVRRGKEWEFKLLAPVPIPNNFESVSYTVDLSDLENIWEVNVPIEDVWETIHNKTYISYLYHFLYGHRWAKNSSPITAIINKQCPLLKTFKFLEDAKKELGSHVKLEKKKGPPRV